MVEQKERDLSSPEVEVEAVEEQPAPVATRVLSAAEILEADDIVVEPVQVPEWGGPGAVVLVQTMTGFARDKFEDSITGKEGGANLSNIRAKMLSQSIVGEDGVLLFTDKDVAKLGKKSSKALDRCFEVARRLSGFTKEDIDELAKN